MKKIIAYILLFIFIFTNMPLEIVLANRQSSVTDLKISDYTINEQIGYNVTLNWDRPPNSTVSDPNAIVTDRTKLHDFENYEIYLRNATKNEKFGSFYSTLTGKDMKLAKSLQNIPMRPGSLYSFKVVPWHTHNYPKGNDVEAKRAPMDYALGTDAEALYLTDISVEAQGVGKELHVTWDNPTLDGKEIFDGYRIYYYQGGPELSPIPTTYYHYVSMASSGLTRTSDGRLQYIIKDNNLNVGKYYAVKVEPVIKNVDLRGAGIKTIDVNGKKYSIAYRAPSKEYRVNEAYIKPALYLKEEGLEYINLYWDSKKNDLGDIIEIKIVSSDNPDFNNSKVIGTVHTEYVRDVNNWIEKKPTTKTYYKYIISYKDPLTGKNLEMESEVAVYDPAYTSFEPYTPNILEITDNKQKPLNLNVLWEGFLRNPYDEEERSSMLAGFNKYLDQNMDYDIWITDDISNFDDYTINQYKIDSIDATKLSHTEFTDIDGIKKIGFQKTFDTYLKKLTNGGYEKVPIEENKVYYVKILAKRKTGELSTPAIGTHYVPPIDDINKQPIMISKPPLKIKKDEKGIDVITTNSIAIEWKLTWLEAFDKDTNSWYTRIARDSNGNIIFGENIKSTVPEENIIDLSSDEYVKLPAAQALAKAKADLAAIGANIPLRTQDLKDASYEISVIKYDEMTKKSSYDQYLQSIIGDDSKWQQITADLSESNPFYNVTGLDENTTYVIFFRPYFMDGTNKKVAYLPNFVIGTTLRTREDLEIKPTVPSIETVSTTDTTAYVRWLYSDELGYDLYISDNSADYPNGGTSFKWDDIKNIGSIKNENGKKYFYFTIENLFPDTEYSAWVRSFANNKGNIVYSEFSNPTYIKTKDITALDSPRGLGPASKNSMNAYNKENNTKLLPAEKDYLIVEFLRDLKDTAAIESKDGKKAEETITEWLKSASIPTTYLTKFNKLIANNDYYVRAKTILTITRAEKGLGITRYYQYVLQFADNPDFLDSIEITIPPLEFKETGNNIISKESEWSATVKLFTNITTDEYDGDKNPAFYPLSEDDIEKIYDDKTKTYTLRIKSDGADAEGNKDYHVDQRLISKFVNNNVYDFVLDMTSYKDKNIENRNIKMPYSIFRTLEERKINLVIKSENMNITIPHNSFNTKNIKNLSDFGYGSYLEINIEKNPNNLPELYTVNGGYVENFASVPQKITAQLKTKTSIVKLETLSKDIKIEMKLDHRYNVLDNNVLAFRHDGNSGGWQFIESTYNNVKGIKTVLSKKMGTYALIARSVPVATETNPYEEYLFNVSSKINITDMPNFEPNKAVSSQQFNNIVYAILKNQKTVLMNSEISDTIKNALTKSNIYMDGDVAVNEAAVSALARVYEIKTGSAIKDYQNSGTETAAKASAKYKVNIQKAYKIGLLEDTIDPYVNLSFGEFFYILDLILSE